MCDLFLVLAKTDEGVSCFAVPRVLPDGTRNTFRLQRLKDKLGNKSNASSEVEFDQTWGRLVGEPGRGVPTIIEMVAHTRLDCVIGSATGMRVGVAAATWHTAHRSAFGKLLIDQPLMQNVLADLCVESEASTALALRLARAYDEEDTAFKRLATAIGKYWTCKRLPGHAVRGDGVPRRQRLRRGVGDAAAVPRGAAQLDLGGRRERQRARRPARARQAARDARALPRRGRRGRGRRRAPRRVRREAEGRVRRARDARGPRPPRRRAPRARAAGLAARAPRAGRGGRRVRRLAHRRATAAWPTARCRRAPTSAASSSGTRPRRPEREGWRLARRAASGAEGRSRATCRRG